MTVAKIGKTAIALCATQKPVHNHVAFISDPKVVAKLIEQAATVTKKSGQ